MALLINKPKNIGNVASLELGVETLLQLLVLVRFGTVPSQYLLIRIKLQVFEFAAAKFLIECSPLRINL